MQRVNMLPLQTRVTALTAPLGHHTLLSARTCGIVSVRQQGACLDFFAASLPEQLPGWQARPHPLACMTTHSRLDLHAG